MITVPLSTKDCQPAQQPHQQRQDYGSNAADKNSFVVQAVHQDHLATAAIMGIYPG